MFKPLLRTLPSLSGNLKLACEINDYEYEGDNTYSTYIRSASLQPLQNNLFNRRINVNLINGTWEYDVAKFYKYYSNYFYKQNCTFLYDDFAKLNLISYNSDTDSRNKDYEFGCKHISFNNTGYMLDFYAPIYVSSIEDLPEYFEIRIDFENGEYKNIKVYINKESTLNYLKVYLNKYINKINRNVAYFISNTGRMIYYGIDVNNGGLVDIEDSHMSKYFKENTTLNNFDSELCAGFMNNKLIMRQIIPLSYHFNLNDIISNYDKKYFIGHKMKISAHYYKNSSKCKFYDFDINYTNKYVIDSVYNENYRTLISAKRLNNSTRNYYNTVDNDSIFGLHEKFLQKYYYTNAITPMYTSWKMMFSSDSCPYITNLNYVYTNPVNNIYGQFPRLFLKYDYNKYAKLNGVNLKLYDESISGKNDKYIENKRLFRSVQNTYMANWYTLLNIYENETIEGILNNENNWFKVENNYAYYKGVLYNFANSDHLNKIDYFGVFVRPTYEILSIDSTNLYNVAILSNINDDNNDNAYGDICINEHVNTLNNTVFNFVNFDKKSMISDIYDFDNLYNYSNYKIANNKYGAKPKIISENIITGKYNTKYLYNDDDVLNKKIYSTLESTNTKNNLYVRVTDIFDQSHFTNFIKDNDKTYKNVFNHLLHNIILSQDIINFGNTNSFTYLIWRFAQLMLKKTSIYNSTNVNNSNLFSGELLDSNKDYKFFENLIGGIENTTNHKWNIFVDNDGQVYEANVYISLNTFNSIVDYNQYILNSNSNFDLVYESCVSYVSNLSESDKRKYIHNVLDSVYSTLHQIANNAKKYEFIFDNISLRNNMSLTEYYTEINNINANRNTYGELNEVAKSIIDKKWPFTSIDMLLAHINGNTNENVNDEELCPNVHFVKAGYVEQIEQLDEENPLNVSDNEMGVNYEKPLFIDAAYINKFEKHKFNANNTNNLYNCYYKYLKNVYGDPYSFFGTNNNIFDVDLNHYQNILSHKDEYEISDFDKLYNVGNYTNNIAKEKGPQYFFNTIIIDDLSVNLNNDNYNLLRYFKYHFDTLKGIDVKYTLAPTRSSGNSFEYSNINIREYNDVYEPVILYSDTQQPTCSIQLDYIVSSRKRNDYKYFVNVDTINRYDLLIQDYESNNKINVQFNSLYQYLSTILTQELSNTLPQFDFISTQKVPKNYNNSSTVELVNEHSNCINDPVLKQCFHTVLNRIICKDNLDRLKFEIENDAPITFRSDIINIIGTKFVNGILRNKYNFATEDGITEYGDNLDSYFYKYNINDNNIYNILITHAMSESKNIDKIRSANPTYFSYPLLYDNVMKLFIDKSTDEIYLFNGSPFLILPNVYPFDNENNGIYISYNDTKNVKFGVIPFVNEGYYNEDIFMDAAFNDYNKKAVENSNILDNIFTRHAVDSNTNIETEINNPINVAFEENEGFKEKFESLYIETDLTHSDGRLDFSKINKIASLYKQNQLNIFENGDVRSQMINYLGLDDSILIDKVINDTFPFYNNSYVYSANSGLYNKLEFTKTFVDDKKYNFICENNDDNSIANYRKHLKLNELYKNTLSIVDSLKNKANYENVEYYYDNSTKIINKLFDNICLLYDDISLQSKYDKYSPKTYNKDSKALFMFTDLGFNDIDNQMFSVASTYLKTSKNESICPLSTTYNDKYLNQLPLYIFPNVFICGEFATLHDISNYYNRKKFENELSQKIAEYYKDNNDFKPYTTNNFSDYSAIDKVYDDNIRIALVSSLKNSYLHNMRNFTELLKLYKDNNTVVNIENIKEYTQKTIDSLVDQSYCYDKSWKNCLDALYNGIVNQTKAIIDDVVKNTNDENPISKIHYGTNVDNTINEVSKFKTWAPKVIEIRKRISQLPEIMYLNYIMQQLIMFATSYNQINDNSIEYYISNSKEYSKALSSILNNRTEEDDIIDRYYCNNDFENLPNTTINKDVTTSFTKQVKANRIKSLYYNGNVSIKYRMAIYDDSLNSTQQSYKYSYTKQLNNICSINEYTNQKTSSLSINNQKQYALYYTENTILNSRSLSNYNTYHYEITDEETRLNKMYKIHYIPSQYSFENMYVPISLVNEITKDNFKHLCKYFDLYVENEYLSYIIDDNNKINTAFTKDALFNIVGFTIDKVINTEKEFEIEIDTNISINDKENNIHTLIYDILLPLASSMNIYRKLLETVKLYKIAPRNIDIEYYDNNDTLVLEKIYDGDYISNCISLETESILGSDEDNENYLSRSSLHKEYSTTNSKYQFKTVVSKFMNSKLDDVENTTTLTHNMEEFLRENDIDVDKNTYKDNLNMWKLLMKKNILEGYDPNKFTSITDTNYFRYIHKVLDKIVNHYETYNKTSYDQKSTVFGNIFIDLYSKKQLLPLDSYLMSNMTNDKLNYQYYIYELCNDSDKHGSNLQFNKEELKKSIVSTFGQNVYDNMLKIDNESSTIHYVKPFSYTENDIYKNQTDKQMLITMLEEYIKPIKNVNKKETKSIYWQSMKNYVSESDFNNKNSSIDEFDIYSYNKHTTVFGVHLNDIKDIEHSTFKTIVSNYIFDNIKEIEEFNLESIETICDILTYFIYVILYRYDLLNSDKINIHKSLFNDLNSFSSQLLNIVNYLYIIMNDITTTNYDAINITKNIYQLLYDSESLSIEESTDVNLAYSKIVNVCDELQKEIENWYNYWYYNIENNTIDSHKNEFSISFENIILIDKHRSLTNINQDLDNLRKVLYEYHTEFNSDESKTKSEKLKKIILFKYVTKNICNALPYNESINNIIDMLVDMNITITNNAYSIDSNDSLLNDEHSNDSLLNDYVKSYTNNIIESIYDDSLDNDTKRNNRHLLAQFINYNIVFKDLKLYYYLMSNNVQFSSLNIESSNITNEIDNIDNNLQILTRQNDDGTNTVFGYYCLDITVTNSSMHYHINDNYDSSIIFTFKNINNQDIEYSQKLFVSKYFNLLYPLLRNDLFINLMQNSKILQKPYQFQQKIIMGSLKNNVEDYQTCFYEYNNGSKHVKQLSNSYNLYRFSDSSHAQSVTLNRYLNYIEPYIKETNIIKDVKSRMFKTNNMIFSSQNLYTEDINIRKYNPLIVFDKLENYNTIKLLNESDSILKYRIEPKEVYQYEYKHFNDNNLFMLENEFEYNDTKLYTYDELLKAESDEIVYKLFRNYIQKRHNNLTLEENEILFLFNKYNVTFKSNFVKFDMTLTNKLYTLKYIFSLK